eukprot:CAMPEP_0194278364 /NCGR_PEP_ID=MMETSP0169-20130528/10422_1 /TAXON_ID=218684 /ORGANISM="Corethron pennatum, Strain L29A3" /LENGTH=69 /DNA_ID=CAMNT_0039022521 /DNA_START=52 /DNA_END=261 /DNA_ORIENTATION=-
MATRAMKRQDKKHGVSAFKVKKAKRPKGVGGTKMVADRKKTMTTTAATTATTAATTTAAAAAGSEMEVS